MNIVQDDPANRPKDKINHTFSCLKWVLSLVLGLLTQDLFSQNQDTTLQYTFESVLFVKPAVYQKTTLLSNTDTVGVSEKYMPDFDVVLHKLPGIFCLNSENKAQDLRINMRGYGSRAAFGIRGIKMYLDGIPLTSPDGTTQMDEMSLFIIDQTQLSGTNTSSVLGNSGGGLIQFKSPSFTKGLNLIMRINSYGAYDVGLQVGFSSKKSNHLFLLSHHRFQSLRQFASGKNSVFYTKNQWNLSSRWSLEGIVQAYFSPEGKDPGALNKESFNKNALSAHPNQVKYQAGEEVSGFTIATKSLFLPSDILTLRSRVFYKTRQFTGRLPFESGGYTELSRQFGGISNEANIFLSKNSNLEFSGGWQYQLDHRSRFDNLDGLKGQLDSDQNESVHNAHLVQQWHFNRDRFSIIQTLRYDYFNFNLEDLFLFDGPQDGYQTFHQLNAGLGIQCEFSAKNHVFLNANTGFETPTLQELSNNPEANSGFLKNLTPEKSFQIETGYHHIFKNKSVFQSTVYLIKLQDVIAGYELNEFPGRVFYRNILEGWRKGGFCQFSWLLSNNVKFVFSYEYSDFLYQTESKSSFTQPLIPKHKIGFQCHSDYKDLVNFSFYLNHFSGMYVNDENTEKTTPQTQTYLSIYTGSKLSNRFVAGLSLQNLFDTNTISNIRANAAGGRYYEAASPFGISLFTSIKIR